MAEWRRQRRAFTKLGIRRCREVARLARRGQEHPDDAVARVAYQWATGTVHRRSMYVVVWTAALSAVAALAVVATAHWSALGGVLMYSCVPIGMSYWWWPVANRIVEAHRTSTDA